MYASIIRRPLQRPNWSPHQMWWQGHPSPLHYVTTSCICSLSSFMCCCCSGMKSADRCNCHFHAEVIKSDTWHQGPGSLAARGEFASAPTLDPRKLCWAHMFFFAITAARTLCFRELTFTTKPLLVKLTSSLLLCYIVWGIRWQIPVWFAENAPQSIFLSVCSVA